MAFRIGSQMLDDDNRRVFAFVQTRNQPFYRLQTPSRCTYSDQKSQTIRVRVRSKVVVPIHGADAFVIVFLMVQLIQLLKNYPQRLSEINFVIRLAVMRTLFWFHPYPNRDQPRFDRHALI